MGHGGDTTQGEKQTCTHPGGHFIRQGQKGRLVQTCRQTTWHSRDQGSATRRSAQRRCREAADHDKVKEQLQQERPAAPSPSWICTEGGPVLGAPSPVPRGPRHLSNPGRRAARENTPALMLPSLRCPASTQPPASFLTPHPSVPLGLFFW